MKQIIKQKIRKETAKKKGEEEGTSPNWAVPGTQNQPSRPQPATPSLPPSFSFLFLFFRADRWDHLVRFFFPGNRSLSLTGNGRLLLPLIPI
jgi:hypothetical protein